MTGFNRMVSCGEECKCCGFELDDGSVVVGHAEHRFHADCILKRIKEKPMISFPCPVEGCGFRASHVGGTGIAVALKQMGVCLSKSPAPLRASPSSSGARRKTAPPSDSLIGTAPPLAGFKRSLARDSLNLGTDSKFDLDVILAASEGDYIQLSFLLSQNRDLSVNSFGETLVAAARSVDDGHVIELIMNYDAVSGEHLGEAALAAMNRGHLNSFQCLIGSDRQMDDASKRKIIFHAIQHPQRQFLQRFLLSGQMDNVLRGLAVKQAIKDKMFDLVFELVPERTRIADRYIEEIFCMAVQLGRLDILELLLNRQHISQVTLCTASQIAKQSKFSAIANRLESLLKK
jgi:hypothetical protein